MRIDRLVVTCHLLTHILSALLAPRLTDTSTTRPSLPPKTALPRKHHRESAVLSPNLPLNPTQNFCTPLTLIPNLTTTSIPVPTHSSPSIPARNTVSPLTLSHPSTLIWKTPGETFSSTQTITSHLPPNPWRTSGTPPSTLIHTLSRPLTNTQPTLSGTHIRAPPRRRRRKWKEKKFKNVLRTESSFFDFHFFFFYLLLLFLFNCLEIDRKIVFHLKCKPPRFLPFHNACVCVCKERSRNNYFQM